MKKENKILIILPTANLGGAERVAFNLACHLIETLHFEEVCVYFMSRGRKQNDWQRLEKFDNANFIYSTCTRERSSLIPLIKYVANTNYKYVYTTHAHVNGVISFLRSIRLLKCQKLIARESTVISDRFSGIKGLEFDFIYKLYRSHDLLICQTKYMYDCLLETRGDKIASNIQVIPNPVNLNYIVEQREVYDIEFDSSFINIVCVGRLIMIKNHSLVLHAINKLTRTFQKKIFIHFIGEGGLNDSLIQLALDLNITQIAFHGNVKNPFSYMNQADIGIISSLKEGFPNVLLEMMASGTKNIISTPCAGDLSLLPSVLVLDDFSPISLSNEIKQSIDNEIDNRLVYDSFIKERTTSSYWTQIKSYLF